MSLYNIQSDSSFNVPKATWNTGNNRATLNTKPEPKISDYTSCIFNLSITGAVSSLKPCRYKTEAWHGSQPSKDLSVFL